jgi:hypothetical protein
MSVWIGRVALPLACVWLSPWASAQALNLRPGGWDISMSLAMGGAAPEVSALKSCVTKEELESDNALQKDESCTRKLTARSPTRYAGTVSCKDKAFQSQGTFEIVASSRESFVMTNSVKGTGPKGHIDMRMEMKGRWASASCQGYDD